MRNKKQEIHKLGWLFDSHILMSTPVLHQFWKAMKVIESHSKSWKPSKVQSRVLPTMISQLARIWIVRLFFTFCQNHFTGRVVSIFIEWSPIWNFDSTQRKADLVNFHSFRTYVTCLSKDIYISIMFPYFEVDYICS